eukprot:snap_masked-scaffold_15-processed-gene-2.50-mRNA-1 protein AED:1.00 eAED:1.00 QI:0/0/0/0/1/1/2/0/153
MMEAISRLSRGRSSWKIRTSYYFDQANSYAKRDWNCKRLKKCKIKLNSVKNCFFEVNIKFNSGTSKYIFIVINEKHRNHGVKVLGKIKNYAQELTAEELKMIKHLESTLLDKIQVKRIIKKLKKVFVLPKIIIILINIQAVARNVQNVDEDFI